MDRAILYFRKPYATLAVYAGAQVTYHEFGPTELAAFLNCNQFPIPLPVDNGHIPYLIEDCSPSTKLATRCAYTLDLAPGVTKESWRQFCVAVG